MGLPSEHLSGCARFHRTTDANVGGWSNALVGGVVPYFPELKFEERRRSVLAHPDQPFSFATVVPEKKIGDACFLKVQVYHVFFILGLLTRGAHASIPAVVKALIFEGEKKCYLVRTKYLMKNPTG